MDEIWSFREIFSWWCMKELFSIHENFHHISFYPGTLQVNNYCKYVNVFQTIVFVAVWKCWMSYFWIFLFDIKFFYILSSWLIIACGTVVVSDRWTILEIAMDLKTKAFPLIVKFVIRHILRTLSTFTIWLWKFISCSSFLL